MHDRRRRGGGVFVSYERAGAGGDVERQRRYKTPATLEIRGKVVLRVRLTTTSVESPPDAVITNALDELDDPRSSSLALVCSSRPLCIDDHPLLDTAGSTRFCPSFQRPWPTERPVPSHLFPRRRRLLISSDTIVPSLPILRRLSWQGASTRCARSSVDNSSLPSPCRAKI